jgi:DNA-binding CsgD family transcriptional regulator
VTLFQRSLHGMVLADDARCLREVNHAACVMVQRPQDELLRSRIDDLTAPAALGEIEAVWGQLLETGSRSGAWPVVTGDQRIVEIEYSAVARTRGELHLIVFVVRRMASQERPDPGQEESGVAGLSRRETEVLRMLALGYTGPEIANRLILGVDTVRTHIRNLKRKLNARTLPHLIALSVSHGLLDAEASPEVTNLG